MTPDARLPPESPPAGRRAAFVLMLPIVSLLLGAWAAMVWATGGFLLSYGPVRFSSRNPRNALILATLCQLIAWLISTDDERRRFRLTLDDAADRLVAHVPRRFSAVVVAAAAVFVIFIGVFRGIGTAAGSDAYGYVSQGELWARGSVRIEEPLVAKVRWPNAAQILSPLGYRPAADGKTIVPVYPPGFPMILGAVERLAGRHAVFYVVPCLGALAVWATYLLGAFIGGAETGAIAAVLLATSPTFLFQDLVAMSDVPVTMWWIFSLMALVTRSPAVAAGAGLAAGMGILTRPNLAPLAIAPAAVLAWRGVRASEERGAIWTRLVLFCAGTAGGCAALAVINQRLYDSPLASGYGHIIDLYSLGNVLTNARLYTAWTFKTQTPLIACALLAPLAITWRSTAAAVAARRAAFTASVVLLVLTVASYLPYAVFDTWFWLRFLLPAWPVLVVLTSLGLVWLCSRLVGRHAVVLAAAVTLTVGCRNVQFVRRAGMFTLKEGERKSPAIGQYIAGNMSDRAVFLAMQQTGSVRYYSGRLSLRFDWIPPAELDRVIADLVRLGYHPYVLVEEWEVPNFRSQFSAESAAGALDWPPLARLSHSTPIRIYDLIDPQRQKLEGRAPKVVF